MSRLKPRLVRTVDYSITRDVAPVAPAKANEPMAMLLFPSGRRRAPSPMAMQLKHSVAASRALEPMATLVHPVVRCSPARPPIRVFNEPLVK